MKILITGAAKRIGRQLAIYLASQGHQLIIHYNTAEKEANDLMQKIGGLEKGHQLIRANFYHQQQVENLFANLQPFDVLINNASTFNSSSLGNISTEQVREDYQINFFAPFTLMQKFKKLCKKGQIINFIDQRVNKVEPSAGIYSLAKKSLRDVTEATAVEWAPDIRVNALAFGRAMKPDDMNDEKWHDECLKAPQQKPVSIDEICHTCQFLLESQATGQILYVDSGLHLI